MRVSTTTPQFRAVANLLGGFKPVELLLWAYGMIESNLNVKTPDSRTGAMGVWQILPSTARKLQKAYELPAFTRDDVTVQSQYALAHVLEDARALRRLGVPPLVKAIAKDTPHLETLLALRFYYHNGPKLQPKAGHEADLKKATLKYKNMLLKNGTALTGDFPFDITQVNLKPYEKFS